MGKVDRQAPAPFAGSQPGAAPLTFIHSPIICNGSHPPPICNGPHPLSHLHRASSSASIALKDHRSSRTTCMTRRLAQPSVYAHLPILLACRSIQHAVPPGLRRHSVMLLTLPEPEGYHQGMDFTISDYSRANSSQLPTIVTRPSPKPSGDLTWTTETQSALPSP